MRLFEKIRAQRAIMQRARAAAAAGQDMDEWQAAEIEAAEKDGNASVWIELIMALLPLIIALFQKK